MSRIAFDLNILVLKTKEFAFRWSQKAVHHKPEHSEMVIADFNTSNNVSPVLDWAAHRGSKFGKIGAGRAARLNVAELRRIHDPATTDPSIKGKVITHFKDH